MPRLIAATILWLLALTSPPLAADLAINQVTVIDVESGGKSLRDVVISDGVITSVVAPQDSQADRVIDGSGHYLVPGLWDSHVHVFSSPDEPATAFDMYLINGVTGVRDMGALLPIEEQKRIQAAIEAGTMRGPRLVLSGAWVDASPGSWPGMFLADTPQQARERVGEIKAQGWAAVKSYSMLSPPVYLALAEAANTAGMPLVGHIPEAVGLHTALDAGQDAMEHFGRVTKACSPQEAAMVGRVGQALKDDDPRSAMIAEMATHNRIVLDSWDAVLCERTIAHMAESGIVVVPTLVVAGFYTGERPPEDALRMQVLPPQIRTAWQQPDFRLDAMTDELRSIAHDSVALDHRTFRMVHRAGVPILASTDASFVNPYLFHGFSLLDELDLYVEIGLTPRQALYAATVAPARFFGLRDQDGSIAPGRRADLVLLDANPLRSLQTLRQPAAVIAKGRLYDREDLKALQEGLLQD